MLVPMRSLKCAEFFIYEVEIVPINGDSIFASHLFNLQKLSFVQEIIGRKGTLGLCSFGIP